ncbi:hypothetical protein TNCV_1215911 [Trichonephila clavipes]|nr:hypothetical protein TNCV_1215911 [Trichonephila clavipes]
MVPPLGRGVSRSLVQGLDLTSLSLSLCIRVSPNRGASRFIWRPLHCQILEQTLYLVHLISSDWSGTRAELPPDVR